MRELFLAAIAALEPWYNWGTIYVERMESITVVDAEFHCGGEGPVRFFDLQWFGVHVGVQLGRTPRAFTSHREATHA